MFICHTHEFTSSLKIVFRITSTGYPLSHHLENLPNILTYTKLFTTHSGVQGNVTIMYTEKRLLPYYRNSTILGT